ncbi:DUF6098 family protein [Streptomyces sp. AC627_RSS907]|uniref:DUF6098 family protein n=1 Tax=Streptomyces sp. AC627_RSS907 TaxID=2823684 RepID=UPI001C25C09C|nr:DUF6098 family protein [Streptomyces sp. AC627_RSS907]
MGASGGLPVVRSLDALAELVERSRGLYVRWSRGPETDLAKVSSTDELTGVAMPGLSANPLDVEAWWADRPVRLWAARRLHDYAHLPHDKGPGVRPWVLTGRETGRGPDNEPLVADVRPLCWVDPGVIDEARAEVERQEHPWGPLRRTGP